MNFLQPEIVKARKTYKGLSTMVANLNEKVNELENEIDNLKEDKTLEEEEKNKLIAEKTRELNTVLDKLTDKQQKLEIAKNTIETTQNKIDELQRRCKTAEDKMAEYNRVINDLLPEAAQKADTHARSLAFNFVCNVGEKIKADLSNIKASLEEDKLEGFEMCENFIFSDGHWLGDWIEHGADIVDVAVALFLGNIEAVMNYCQTSGSGGVSSSDCCGRKKDEDDNEYMMRCLKTAYFMTKPPVRKVKVSPNKGGFRR